MTTSSDISPVVGRLVELTPDAEADISRLLAQLTDEASADSARISEMLALPHCYLLVARTGERIVGMASVMKTDYYPLPEVFPWVSSLFVSENHRGRGLSGQLIDGANRYLRDLGFPAATSPPRFSACMSALATPISGTSSTTAAAQTICLERNGDMILYFSATGNCK